METPPWGPVLLSGNANTQTLFWRAPGDVDTRPILVCLATTIHNYRIFTVLFTRALSSIVAPSIAVCKPDRGPPTRQLQISFRLRSRLRCSSTIHETGSDVLRLPVQFIIYRAPRGKSCRLSSPSRSLVSALRSCSQCDHSSWMLT